MTKKVFKVISIGILIVILGFFMVFWYLCEASKIHFDLPKIAKEIYAHKPMPDNMDMLLDTLQPVENKCFKIYREKVFSVLSGIAKYPRREGEYKNSYSEDALDVIDIKYLPYDWSNIFDEHYVFSCGIEKYVDAKILRNYYFQNKKVYLQQSDSSLVQCKGIEEVAKFRFKKSIEELQSTELIEVMTILDNNKHGLNDNKKFEARVKLWEFRLQQSRKN